MLFQILTALLCTREIAAIPTPQRRSTSLKTVDADHVLHMKRTGKKQASSRALLLETADDIAPLQSVEGTSYSVEIKLSGDPYDVIFDTGSSDLWVFHAGFTCLNSQGSPVATSRCDIGPEYTGDYDDGTVDNQHFVSMLYYTHLQLTTDGKIASSLSLMPPARYLLDLLVTRMSQSEVSQLVSHRIETRPIATVAFIRHLLSHFLTKWPI